jgi:hypothetical protein
MDSNKIVLSQMRYCEFQPLPEAEINYHPDAKLLVQHFLTDDAHSESARLWSQHSDCLYRVLVKWPTSKTSSSGAQKVSFDWKRSFNAQDRRMGDL